MRIVESRPSLPAAAVGAERRNPRRVTPADFGGADNVLAFPDHYNHIHVGFRPMPTVGAR
jgi:hypothetical protein